MPSFASRQFAFACLLRPALLVAVVLVLISEASTLAREATHRAGQSVVVPADETIRGDLFCMGETIVVLGRVEGDLFALGQSIRVEGPIGGSLHAFGETIVSASLVEGSGRLAGGNVDLIGGTIGRDLRVIAANFRCHESVTVEGGLAIAGLSSEVSGRVKGSAQLAVASTRIFGQIDGPVTIRHERVSRTAQEGGIQIGSSAVLGSSLSVTGTTPAQIDEGASVTGPTSWNPVSIEETVQGSNPVRSWAARSLCFAFAVTCFSLLFPVRSRNAMRLYGARPFRVALLGPIYWLMLVLTTCFIGLSCLTLGIAVSLISLQESLPLLVCLAIIGVLVVGGGGAIVGIWVSPTLCVSCLIRSIARRIPGFRGDSVLLPGILGGMVTAALLQVPQVGLWLWALLALYGSGVFLMGTAPPPMPARIPKLGQRSFDRIR